MRKIRWAYIVILSTLALFLSANAYAVSWEYNFDAALKKAKDSQKPLMLDFYTEWCGWCKRLDSDTYTDAKVNELSKKFICVKIDAEKNRHVASKYDVKGYPTIIFLNYEGEPEGRIGGYLTPDKFFGIMDSILKKTKKPAAKAAPPQKAKAKFILNGILYDKISPTAIVNGTPVKVGDTVDGAKVKKITNLDVELEYEGSQITLIMK